MPVFLYANYTTAFLENEKKHLVVVRKIRAGTVFPERFSLFCQHTGASVDVHGYRNIKSTIGLITNRPYLRRRMAFNKNLKWLIAGVSFSILWASASTATKIGLQSAQPLVIGEVRFFAAAFLMLTTAYFINKNQLPRKEQWMQLAVYGFLNISVYLGLYVIAMQNVTAGIGALSIASAPVFISFFSIFFLKMKLHPFIVFSIIICVAGVICASWPLLFNSSVSIQGLVILFSGMLSYSFGAIYFSSRQWNGLSLLAINGWQTFFGGLFLLPVTLIFYKQSSNHFNSKFWLAVGWLAIPVSIFAIQLWLWLLRISPVRASLWLFLCPLFGFILASIFLKDQISVYTIIGVMLVIGGLLLSKLKSGKVDQ